MTETGFISDAKLRGLERRLRNLVAGMDEQVRAAYWKFDAYSTEYFPFRAYASAFWGSTAHSDPDLVIALQCQRPAGAGGSRIRLFADLSTGDGNVVAESPVYELELPGDRTDTQSTDSGSNKPIPLASTLDQQMRRIINILHAWLQRQRPLIEEILSPDGDMTIIQRLQLVSRLDTYALQLGQEARGKMRPSSVQIIRESRARQTVAA